MERPTSCLKRNIRDLYEIEYVIGSGAFGNVSRAAAVKDKKLVAIKTFKKNKDGEIITSTICREIALLREIDNQNMVHLEDIFVDPVNRDLYIVFEYAEYDLNEIIKWHRDFKTPISEGMVKSFLWQILNGINYLHTNWVIHRDMKPSNVLVMGEGKDEGVVKVADLGLARIFQAPLCPLSENGLVVTIWYRAPELLLGTRHYTRAIDMWAIGCIFAELMTCAPIFPGEERMNQSFQDNQLIKIGNILGPLKPSVWPECVKLPYWNRYQELAIQHPAHDWTQKLLPYGDAAMDLIKKMLHYNPNQRITASAAINHRYFFEKPLPSINSFDYNPNWRRYPMRTSVKPAKTHSN
ncbi:probable cyclin-dependent kinase 8 [Schistocerca gregaria]|uniref:probable cyclin-dependent kinase 8 n=1 Tax=Schistocerca gregaria TaxID=7010 RepID=UPI00211DFCF6|nr:probable cyclin-dependent kinase 8 [Schistocerca gregaria]